MNASRFPISLSAGAATLLPHLAHFRALARLVAFEAIHHALEGKPAEAARSIELAFALCRTLRDEPLLISQYVRAATLAIALSALEKVLNAIQVDAADAARLGRVVAEAEQDSAAALRHALIGERATGISTFQLSYRELEQLSPAAPAPDRLVPEVFSIVAFNTARVLGQCDLDLTVFLQSMEDLISAATNPFPQAVVRSKAAEEEMQARLASGPGRLALVSKSLLPALAHAGEKEAMLCARLRCARVALAIEQHRTPARREPIRSRRRGLITA